MQGLNECLENFDNIDVEDCSTSFCKMMIANKRGQKIILAYFQKYMDEYEATKHYMHSIGIVPTMEVRLKDYYEMMSGSKPHPKYSAIVP